MDADEALRFVEELIRVRGEKPLNDLQRTIFRGSWLGQDYKEIHRHCEQVGLAHLMRNVGPKLWKSLSHLLTDLLDEAIEVKKDYLQGPIQRLHDRLHPQNGATFAPEPVSFDESEFSNPMLFDPINRKQDWGHAPDVSLFQGRSRELEELHQWTMEEGCRLIALVGTAGIGKTVLSVKLTELLRDRFEYVVWRSLDPALTGQPAPTLPNLLADLIQVLADQPDRRADLTRFLEYLRDRRCLVVLDGFDAVMQGGQLSGDYLPGYAGYGDLLRRVGSTHQLSCVVLTSREKPVEIEQQDGESAPVRCQFLGGLRTAEAQNLMLTKGNFTATEPEWRSLVYQYDGNPRFLQQVATTIVHAFGRDVSRFLTYQQDRAIFVGDIRRLLDQQISRLSNSELTIIRALAHYREPATLEEIQQFATSNLSRHHLLEVLLSLVRRSLLSSSSISYSLHPLLIEYVNEYL